MDEFLSLLKQYAPALLVLVISMYRDRAIRAEHATKIAELEKKILENHNAVERENAGKSDIDIIDDVIRSGSNGKS